MKHNLIISALLFFGLISCNKNIAPQDKPIENEQKQIPIKIATSPWTKVTDASYENGDKVGIYTVNHINGNSGTLAQSGNHLDNFAFTFNGTEWIAAGEAYWKDDNTPADFYCYYPYTASVTNIHAVPFAVKTDQSQLADYKASEFMYGKTLGAKPSEKAVAITTKHTMSNVIITLLPGKGYTTESLAAENITITITGVMTEGTIDLETGVATATGTTKNMIPYKENNYWRALVMPQNIIGTQLLNVKVGNNTYTLNQTVTFKSNHQHKCTLTVNKISEGVNIGIDGWVTDDTDFGGVLE